MKIAGFAAGPFQTNCYVVVNEATGEAIVVDPGMGTYDRATALLEQEGAELKAVVLTHGHIDHTRDAAAFGVETFIHPADAFMLERGDGVSEQTRMLFDANGMTQIDHLTDMPEVLEVAGFRFSTAHAPGHSPGSVMLTAADEGVVFSGDVLFRGSVGRTDLEHSDPARMRETLRGPVWELDDALNVLPGHGPATTMAHERATNPFLLEANAGR